MEVETVVRQGTRDQRFDMLALQRGDRLSRAGDGGGAVGGAVLCRRWGEELRHDFRAER